MGAAEFAALVEATFLIRHAPGWGDARRALQESGIDPVRAICTYFGGWGENGCGFVLPDGRFVFANMLFGWDGRFFVPAEDIEEEIPLEPREKLARSIIASGNTREFDAAVLERWQRETATRDAAGRAGSQ